ncbi:MAG: Thymidylate kinase [Syntrophorhabdus sp. PtaB.Bin006]|nr:MAG: Thymidylate kinase [Syntrophorhabdus sp. PtaB.Bin006]
MLITFEGIEGCGKSTQVELLYTYLTQKGRAVVKTREPGGTPFGEALRKVCLTKNMTVFPLPELLTFMAIRAQHVEEVIMPALEKRQIVLCDRFIDATYAYQGYGRGVDLGVIQTLNRLATKGIRPHLTVLLDCAAGVGLKRKAGHHPSLDRFEKEALSFHRKIRNAYTKLAKEDPKRFFVVDANGDVEAIHQTIREKVDSLLKDHGIR